MKDYCTFRIQAQFSMISRLFNKLRDTCDITLNIVTYELICVSVVFTQLLYLHNNYHSLHWLVA